MDLAASGLTHDQFIVALLTRFDDSPFRKDLLAVLSKIVAGETITSDDDGVSQKVNIKTGIQRIGQAEIRNPVYLRPFCTFPEIVSAERPFVLRISAGSGGIVCRLHGSKDPRWEVQTKEEIKTFLKEKTDGIVVIC